MTPPRKHPETGPLRSVWQEMNRLIDYTESLRIAPSPTVHPKRTAQGTTLEVRPGKASPPGEPGIVQRLLVLQVWPDHLVCERTDGTPGTVNVAKPWTLRQTPFHGKIINYVDEQGRFYDLLYEYLPTPPLSPVRRKVTITSQGGIVEFQVIVPRYNANDTIFAATVSEESGTGVIVGTVELELVDINADGRYWARER